MKYLNIGCGKKFSEEKIWQNVDMVSHSKYVKKYNILKGLPYKNDEFAAIYHSQVLEHIPKENAANFLKECYRVLKSGGILRVVVPDLENIINEYQKFLKQNIDSPTKTSIANYDWIMIELFDQTIRSRTGGLLKEYLEQSNFDNEEYLKERMGFIGNKIVERKSEHESSSQKIKRVIKSLGFFSFVGKILSMTKEKILGIVIGKKYRLGSFRLSGEIHYWMYDRYSLGRLLESVGFRDVKVQTAHTSDIKDWQKYELDVKDGMVYDPTSLFIEAKK